jgi:hypothetical protein
MAARLGRARAHHRRQTNRDPVKIEFPREVMTRRLLVFYTEVTKK